MSKDPLETLFGALKEACQETGHESVVLVSGWPGSLEDCLYFIPKQGRLQWVDCNNRPHGYIDPRLEAIGWREKSLAEDIERAIEKVRRGEIDTVTNYDDM
jgi:hypothetical protein